MKNNFTMLAQNSNVDYVQQAYLSAMSIRATNKDAKICLITNDNVSKKYKKYPPKPRVVFSPVSILLTSLSLILSTFASLFSKDII